MNELTTSDLFIYGFVNLITGIFSGIAGAGGGFVMTPLLIFLGATPAQAVSSGKFSGLAVSLGSLAGLKKAKIRSKREVAIVIALAFIAGLLAPLVITNLDSEVFKKVLGILLLVMIPLLYIKKVGLKKSTPSPKKRFFGFSIVGSSLFLQGVFSGGIGTFVSIALMSMLGMSALEANVVKRYSQVILNTVIIVGVFTTGLILWKVVLFGVTSAVIGGFIGGKMAIKKGDKFIMNIFMIFMLVSGIALLTM